MNWICLRTVSLVCAYSFYFELIITGQKPKISDSLKLGEDIVVLQLSSDVVFPINTAI